ncbi:hypothetical protein ACRAWF_44430 [Streptomyces sp. L7]
MCLHRSDPEHQRRRPRRTEGRHRRRQGRRLCSAARSPPATPTEAAGIPPEVLHVIPSGVDLLRFRPDPARRLAFRASLGIPDAAPVVVFAARYATMKNILGSSSAPPTSGCGANPPATSSCAAPA